MPPALFCHALCTVPLHICIYCCVFQDQNEWQIGSSTSQRDITAVVGVSRGPETGGMCLNGRDRSEQGGFCSCLSEAPQVIKWASSESEAGRQREGEVWMEYITSLSLHSNSFSSTLTALPCWSQFSSHIELDAANPHPYIHARLPTTTTTSTNLCYLQANRQMPGAPNG